MAAREWKPSARASELIDTMMEAYATGDRWVKLRSPHTARYTGVSLVWNGIAEFDPESMRVTGGYGMRIRLSREWAAANGWTCWQDAARELFGDDN